MGLFMWHILGTKVMSVSQKPLTLVIMRFCEVNGVPSHRPSQSLSADIRLVENPHADRG